MPEHVPKRKTAISPTETAVNLEHSTKGYQTNGFFVLLHPDPTAGYPLWQSCSPYSGQENRCGFLASACLLCPAVQSSAELGVARDAACRYHRGDAMSAVYDASSIKRQRSTKAAMAARADLLIEIVHRSKPCTVRQVFYQATVHGIVDKTEAGYAKVQRQLVDLRRAGAIPFPSITDNTRWQRKPQTFDSMAEAVEHTAATYRRSVWSEMDTYVEVWLEKDALSGVLMQVTNRYDIPLMVARRLLQPDLCAGRGRLHAGPGKAGHRPALRRPRPKRAGRGCQDRGCVAGVRARHRYRVSSVCRDTKPDRGMAVAKPSYQGLRPTEQEVGGWRAASSLMPLKPTTCERCASRGIEDLLPEGWLNSVRAAEESERSFLTTWANMVAGAAG